MKTLVGIIPLFLILVAAACPIAIAQNMTIDSNESNTESAGLSAESVDLAKSNTTDLTTNTTGNNTESAGLSAESVDTAVG